MAHHDNDPSKSRPVRDSYPRPRDTAQETRDGIAPPPATPTRSTGRPGGTVERFPTTRRRSR